MSTSFSYTITDGLGRQVTLPAPPKRIVSLAPGLTETLCLLGGQDRLVGITTIDSYPPEILKLPIVGEMVSTSINLETILGLKPDLVFATGANGIQNDVIKSLERANIPVYAADPKTVAEIATTIEGVGEVCGLKHEGPTKATEFRARIAAARERAKLRPAKPRVLCVVGAEPVYVAGPKTFMNELIELAGGQNALEENQVGYLVLSDEQILKMQPEVILAPDHGAQNGLAGQLKQRVGWNELKAIRDNKIIVIHDDLLTRPGPRVADGVEALEKSLK
jgi:iron complex transport system substrate-binding protein